MKQIHRRKVKFHTRRIAFFTVMLLALAVARLDSGSTPQPSPLSNRASVLAYASEMSRQNLLDGTNSARGANGLGGLTLHSQLNAAAQAKAEDMAAKNYWSHVAPDGTEPWYFFDQAGYQYVRAGENLAYGFSTSQGAVTGWMNSPSHRANMLGEYVDVGFGIVNSPNYQSGGEQTIVVAHYGSVAGAQAPAPPVTAPASLAPPANPTSPTVSPALPTSTPDAPTPTASPSTQDDTVTAAPLKETPTNKVPVSIASEPQTISLLSLLARQSAPVTALTSLVLVTVAISGYALTHRAAFQHAVTSGEHFVLKHPGIDTAAVGAIMALIVLTTYGNIA